MGRRSAIVVLALLAACTDLGGLSNDDSATPPPGGHPDGGGDDDGGSSDAAPNPCEGGLASCGDLCIDSQTDARHCGRCGHSCLGGTCKAGQCQPIELAKNLDIPQGLAQDKDYLYVAVYGASEIIRVAKADGTVTSISKQTTSPSAIAVKPDAQGAASLIAWGEERFSSNANVMSCAPSSCNAPNVSNAGGTEVDAILFTGGKLFWTQSSSSSGQVMSCTEQCTSGLPIGSALPHAHGLVSPASGTLVAGARTALGSVTRMTTDGTGIAKLFDANEPEGLASDGTNVYAALNGANAIAKCALTGCIGTNTTLAFAQAPHGVATDGKNVYWGNGLANGGSVAYCPTAGCPGGAVLLAADQKNPFGIVVDDVAVYWANSTPGGSIVKIAKP